MNYKDNLPLNFREKQNHRTSLICAIVVLILIVLFFKQLDYYMIRKPAVDARKKAEQEQQKEEDLKENTTVNTVSIVAAGDNLFHQSLMDSGRSESGSWNYDHIYSHIQNEIAAADLALINQETVFTSNHEEISSYPLFASPTEVGDALINAGFDVIASANNHIDDQGSTLITQTLNFWKTKHPDIPILGIHETQADADTIRTVSVNDITISFLNYTYGTNTCSLSEEESFMIDTFDKEKVASDVAEAQEISDCVIVIAHWGAENNHMPDEYEKQWAAYLMQLGVDVVIGSNPHVLQPYGRMSDEAGNEMLIFYSLGNFVSGQEELQKLLGGLACFTIQKTTIHGNSSIEILTPEVKPIVIHYDYSNKNCGPYLLENYTEDLASQHSVREIIYDEFTLANLQNLFEQVMSTNVTPSTGTNLLNVRFDQDRSMIDKTTGNYVEAGTSVEAEDSAETETFE